MYGIDWLYSMCVMYVHYVYFQAKRENDVIDVGFQQAYL